MYDKKFVVFSKGNVERYQNLIKTNLNKEEEKFVKDINETLENLELQNSTNKEMTQYARKLEIESKQRQTQRAKEKQNNFKEYVDKNSFDFQ